MPDSCDTLLIDSYNLIHRSRFDWGGGLAVGEHQITYNFLKSIRPILERFCPKKVYFVLDGAPKQRLELDETYKANRKQENLSEEEQAYWKLFHSQKREIIQFVKELLPFTTVYHPDFECDDILNFLAVNLEGDTVIISSDTDFIQTLDLAPNVRLWNPVSQQFREKMEVDYTKYKALVGDKTDNIPGVSGVGKVGALKMLKDPSIMEKKMALGSFKEQFDHSYQLVKFADISTIKSQIQYFKGDFDRDEVELYFEKWGFSSMLNEKYFQKYSQIMEEIQSSSE